MRVGRQGGGGSSDDGSGPIEITAILSISGVVAVNGEAMSHDAKPAVAHINAEGGIDGRKVELTILDDAGDPTKAVSLVQEMIASGDLPDGVIPGVLPTVTSAIVPVLAKAGIFVSQHGTDPSLNDPDEYPLTFGSAYLPSSMAEDVAAKFVEQGFESVGMLSPDDVSGHAAAEATQKAVEDAGLSIDVVFVPATDVDVTAQMEQVIAGDSDVLLISGSGPAAGPMIEAKAKLKPSMPVYANQNFSANNLAGLAPEDAYDGMTMQAIAWAVAGSEPTKGANFTTFKAAMDEETGGDYPFAMFYYVVPWNDVVNITSAIDLADSTDPEKMATALESASAEDMPLFLGPVDFDPDNHYPLYKDDYWVWLSYAPSVNGQFQPAS